MNKFVVNKFGLVTLTIVFILLYGYMNAFDGPANTIEKKDSQEQHIFNEVSDKCHFLVDVEYSEEDEYCRISIPIKINENVLASGSGSMPPIDVQQLTREDLPEVYGPWIDVEDYCIKISMANTATVRIANEGVIERLIDSKNIQVRNGLITDIDLISVQESTSDILIGLNEEVEYRISDDKSGIIFIDILK